MIFAIRAAWLFLKKYWFIFVAIVLGIAGVIFFKKPASEFIDDYLKIKSAHDSEIRKVKEAREEEVKQKKRNKEIYDIAVSQAAKNYVDDNKKLDLKKKKEAKKIIKQHGDDPKALAKELSKTFGFSVVVPKDDSSL